MSPSPAPKTEPAALMKASPGPTTSELEIEIALLRGVVELPPTGQHRHLVLIQLQNAIHARTGLWVPPDELWERLEGFYDMAAIDEMHASSSNSLPSSPAVLSPLVKAATARSERSTESPLSDISSPRKPKRTIVKGKAGPGRKGRSVRETDEEDEGEGLGDGEGGQVAAAGSKGQRQVRGGKSRSAQVINSKHFKDTFDLPYFAKGKRGKTRPQAEEGEGEDQGEEEEWRDMIYPRALDPAADEDGQWPPEGAGVGETAAEDAEEGGDGDDGRVEPRKTRQGRKPPAQEEPTSSQAGSGEDEGGDDEEGEGDGDGSDSDNEEDRDGEGEVEDADEENEADGGTGEEDTEPGTPGHDSDNAEEAAKGDDVDDADDNDEEATDSPPPKRAQVRTYSSTRSKPAAVPKSNGPARKKGAKGKVDAGETSDQGDAGHSGEDDEAEEETRASRKRVRRKSSVDVGSKRRKRK
ncbi:hypothetical protein IAU60_004950 [Kwoniella sp. DSM 27419]